MLQNHCSDHVLNSPFSEVWILLFGVFLLPTKDLKIVGIPIYIKCDIKILPLILYKVIRPWRRLKENSITAPAPIQLVRAATACLSWSPRTKILRSGAELATPRAFRQPLPVTAKRPARSCCSPTENLVQFLQTTLFTGRKTAEKV